MKLAVQNPAKILVKLPVKMGDTVMAAYFLRAVKALYPNCQLDAIVAKGLEELMDFMPYVDNMHAFSKKEYPGPKGNYRYGKLIRKREKYDVFFCLPFSFSSALMGYFTGAKVRIGYKTEFRGIFLSNAIKRPKGLHIVEEFNYLLERYSGKKEGFKPLSFKPRKWHNFQLTHLSKLILNVKSGPPSRSIPVEKGVSLVKLLLSLFPHEVLLTGAPNESVYISEIKKEFRNEPRVIDLSGKTTLSQLAYVISKADCMVTADSGNAHLANAVGTPTVVLFGAAYTHRAKPYNDSISRILQRSDMDCVPCESEHCKYGDNRCLTNINNVEIVSSIKALVN